MSWGGEPDEPRMDTDDTDLFR